MLYLVKKNKVYYLRIRIPKDVKQYFPSSEIKKSLHTSSYKNACSQNRLIVAETEKVFMMIRSNMLTTSQVYKIVEKYLDDLLSHHEKVYEEKLKIRTREHMQKYVEDGAARRIDYNRKLLIERACVKERGGKTTSY